VFESQAKSNIIDSAELHSSEIDALHDRCGIYTKLTMVERILDAIGWTADADLSRSALLEPAAGDGIFVVEAAKRLLGSLKAHSRPATPKMLFSRITAFELLESEAVRGRAKLVDLMSNHGLRRKDAVEIAAQWLRTADFLLEPLPSGSWTHVAGNPPYARWAKIPAGLRLAYEQALPAYLAKGDLFLPFLDRGIEALAPQGRLGFLCSNRWEFMQFGEGFRQTRLLEVRILENTQVDADDAYQRPVHIYPSVLIVQRRTKRAKPPAIKRTRTLVDAGFEVRVGPALGCTDAYVLHGEDNAVIEAELLAPWLAASEVGEGEVRSQGNRIICLYDDDGRLRDLAEFPLAEARLRGFEKRLRARSIVRTQKAVWYRPIDRVYAAAWRPPKLLVPELAKVPRLALDTTGAVPSHGIYAIFAKADGANLDDLRERLADGGLKHALDTRAPRVKGGYMRCYKRFLEAIEV
jgi:hypothetical protein